jgi:hypothetical protein
VLYYAEGDDENWENKIRDKKKFREEVKFFCRERNDAAARKLAVLASHNRVVTDLIYQILQGGVPTTVNGKDYVLRFIS